jgi:hypothetical protein
MMIFAKWYDQFPVKEDASHPNPIKSIAVWQWEWDCPIAVLGDASVQEFIAQM